MAKTFRLEIVTPEKTVYSEEVTSLRVPAENGYLGVLAGHAPLLASLRPGEISLRRDSTEIHFATSGGFMEVTPKKTSILCESSEAVSGINLERAEKARQRAKDRLAKTEKGLDRARAEAALARAENRLDIAKKFGK